MENQAKDRRVNPKVSVIVPVHNTERYLRQCLDSLVRQTLREIEIICIDDGSSDGSLAILMDYAALDSRVRVIEQEGAGAGAARNVGLDVALGEYVIFLDSDDFFELCMLEEAYVSEFLKVPMSCFFRRVLTIRLRAVRILCHGHWTRV